MTQSSGCREWGETACARVFFFPPCRHSPAVSFCLCVFVCMHVSVYVCVGLTEDKGMWSESALCPLSFPPYSTHPKVCLSLDEFSIFCLLLQADAALLSQRRESSTDLLFVCFFFLSVHSNKGRPPQCTVRQHRSWKGWAACTSTTASAASHLPRPRIRAVLPACGS